MTIYVFDMDGTLTPPRLPMTKDFARFFLAWQKLHTSYIVTGSDMNKVKEQLAADVILAFDGIYASMGNLLWAKGKTIYQHEFEENPLLIKKLESFRKNTTYPYALFDNYIEKRAGMINFSVLGRNCPYEEREKYGAWDKVNQERYRIREELLKAFSEYDISVGGTISIDITPKGKGKEQVAFLLRKDYPNEKIIFFGDRTLEGGNDFPLAFALRQLDNTDVIQVDGPEDVLNYLSQMS